ncbi:hypothetical protein HJG60_009068 [Phyllostomus discolor]|uniref:Uncharacterized protein n=1 Tax=Phyllostomus discolor TaxID=89673 RepID=A0A833YPD6_9CHIR|nr:hypothetical protein HJG60_009068 [Phyllostomus discolor]
MFVTLRGRPTAVMCRGPPGTKFFALLKKDGRYACRKLRAMSQHGSQGPEARLHIPAVSEDTASHYACLHHQGSSWVVFCKPLKPKVTVKDISTLSSETTREITPPPTEVPLVPTEVGSQTAPASWNYTVENCVHIGLAGVVLLSLVGILAEAGHSQHRRPHGPQ